MTLPPLADWPDLAHLYHLHPSQVRLIPEEGGLTWSELLTFTAALRGYRDEMAKRR